MFKKVMAVVLAGLICTVGVVPAYAAAKEEKEARFALKVKDGIGKLGTGTEARVEVKLRDKTKLKGYISESGDESFVIVDKTGMATTVAYPQVKQVKGNNLNTAAEIALGVGVILLPIAIVLLLITRD